jgi:hypothetical protein
MEVQPPTGTRRDWPGAMADNQFLVPVEYALSLDEDPEGFMATALARAKWWVSRGEDLTAVHDAYRITAAYLSYCSKRQFSQTVLLDAEEIIRRAEYRIEVLVSIGQDQGIIRSKEVQTGIPIQDIIGIKGRDLLTNLRKHGRLSEVSTENFEAAIALARDAKNMSRAKLLRIITGTEQTKERDEWNYGRRRIDSNKIVSKLADQMEALTGGLDLVEPSSLDPGLKEEAKETIRSSIAFIQKEMKKW